jgi:hypothetical protein
MVLPTIFEFNQPQHIRAVMSQLFREITLLPYDDLAKRTYNYRVTFSVANAVAQLTGTPVLLDDWQTIEYQVRSTSAGGKRSAMVYQLMEDGTYSDENLGQTRDCVVCSLELPVEEFGKRKKDGYYTRCESCRTCWNARCRKHNRTWEARRAAKTAELAEAA